LHGVFVGRIDRMQQRVDLGLRSSGLLLQIYCVLGRHCRWLDQHNPLVIDAQFGLVDRVSLPQEIGTRPSDARATVAQSFRHSPRVVEKAGRSLDCPTEHVIRGLICVARPSAALRQPADFVVELAYVVEDRFTGIADCLRARRQRVGVPADQRWT
jgi:hypothetical protein